MMAVGFNALTASTKVDTGARSWANGHSLERHGLADQLRDSGPSRTAAQKQQTLLGDLLPSDTQSGKDTGQRDTRGALDVIVVGADLIAIAREDRHRVDVGEVLPLDATFWVERLYRRHELLDEGRIFFAADAVLAQPEIERVIEELLIIRADVQNYRQAVLRRHAGAGRIERELAERYAHSPGAKVTQPEDTLSVGHHDEAHVLFRPIAEDLPDPAASADRQIHASRLAEDMGELLTGLADRRRVDQRHIGRRVRHQDCIEQRLVPGLQIREHEIFLQVVIEIGDFDVPVRHLQLRYW